MKLILLRHGESQWNLENRFTGWKDVSLTPTGITEASFSRIESMCGFSLGSFFYLSRESGGYGVPYIYPSTLPSDLTPQYYASILCTQIGEKS